MPIYGSPAGKSWSELLYYDITALPTVTGQLVPAGYKVMAIYGTTNDGNLQISYDGGTNWLQVEDVASLAYNSESNLIITFLGVPISDGTNVRIYNSGPADRSYRVFYQEYS